MMIEIAGGIVLGFVALWILNYMLGALLISFLTPEGQKFWLVMVVLFGGLILLFSLPSGLTATILLGGFVFGLMRAYAPNWTPWRDNKGESMFGGAPPRPRRPPYGPNDLDLRPIKTDRRGNRL